MHDWKELSQKTDSLEYQLVKGLSENLGFSLKTPWKDLPAKAREAILYGQHLACECGVELSARRV